MDQLILCRQGIESLNFDEFIQCIHSFLRLCTSSCRRDCLSHIIFTILHNDFKQNRMININTMNNIMREITSSRSTDSVVKNENDMIISTNNENQDNKQYEYKKLDQLPSALLFEISTYLQFSEALQFEKVNGSIFIGSRFSKMPIHSINHSEFTKLLKYYDENQDCRHQMRLFKSVTINADNVCDEEYDEPRLLYRFDQFALDLFKNIQSLTIKTEYSLTTILYFLQCDQMDLSNLKTLRLLVDDTDFQQWDVDLLKSLIFSKAKNIAHFECDTWFECDFAQSDFEWISNLNGLAVTDQNGMHEEKIYFNIGANLTSLHRISISEDIISKLMNVSELCIYSIELNDKLYEILLKEEFNYLKRIYLSRCSNYDINEKYMPLLIKKWIKNLDFIGMDFWDDFKENNILNILSESFKFSMGTILKIRINNVKLYDDLEINAFIQQLEELLSNLDSHYANWMLMVHKLEISTVIPLYDVINMKKGMEEYDFNYIINEKIVNVYDIELKRKQNNVLDKLLERILALYHVQSEKILNEDKCEQYNFVINNIGCPINGYQETWNMSCSYCNQIPIFN